MAKSKVSNRIKKFIVFIFCSCLLLNCKSGTTPPYAISSNLPLVGPTSYKNIEIRLVDYNTVRITHSAGLEVQSPEISQIEIGVGSYSNFSTLAKYPSTYDTLTATFLIHFDFTQALDSTRSQVPLTVRYLRKDSNPFDVTRTVDLFKYPYPSAEIFADSSLIYSNSYQDIVRTESKLYYHGMSSSGLFGYDLNTHQKSLLFAYFSGSHIAADANYVYCDISHHKVVRYNRKTNMIDLTILDFTEDTHIIGLAKDSSSLLAAIRCDSGYYLRHISPDGVMGDSIPMPDINTYFMAVSDSVVYRKFYTNGPSEISRFSLSTKSLLPNVLSPARNIEGMDIFQDTLYYCDLDRNFVGKVPVNDLIPVQQKTAISKGSQ